MKKLMRDAEGKVFLGVLSGMGDYFEIDPVILRVFYVVATFFTGIFPGFIAYLLSAAVMPVRK